MPNKQTLNYKTHGTCSRNIGVTIEDGIVKSVVFTGGCHGNLQGITKLVVGRPAREVADTLRGINCNGKGTSCPDQLAHAIDEILNRK